MPLHTRILVGLLMVPGWGSGTRPLRGRRRPRLSIRATRMPTASMIASTGWPSTWPIRSALLFAARVDGRAAAGLFRPRARRD